MIENYDHCLNFEVTDKHITFVESDVAQIVANNYGCICIHIDFDSQWDGVIKTARFIHEGRFIDVVLDNNECICPKEVARKGRISLGVYGGDLKSTTPVTVEVEESILSLSGEALPEAPTDDVYTQLMSKLSANQVAVDEATQACWDAVNAADGATKALFQAKDELENGGFIMSIKERNKGVNLSFWVGTKEEYEAQKDNISDATFCIVLDDDTAEVLVKQISDINATLQTHTRALAGADNKINALNQHLADKEEIVVSGNSVGTVFEVGTYYKSADGVVYLYVDIDNASIPSFSSFSTDLGADAPNGTVCGVVNASYTQDAKFYTEPVSFIINSDGSIEVPSYVYTGADTYKGLITYICKPEAEEV